VIFFESVRDFFEYFTLSSAMKSRNDIGSIAQW